MRRSALLSRIAAAIVALAVLAPPASGQHHAYPPISQRQFTGGSAKLIVKGSAQIDQEIPINDKASIGDGETTWLQFGASGDAAPNVLVTYGETGEIGITIGKGRFSATGGITPGEKPQCTGKSEVNPTLVTGQYTCPGITSYDAGSGKMGQVDIEIRFTAKT
jgi:hypothetical protein